MSDLFSVIDLDLVSLISGRLADEGICFGMPSEMVSATSVARPDLFNHFVIHGRWAYIKRYRHEYCLVVSGFNPKKEFGWIPLSYNRHQDRYLLRKSSDFWFVYRLWLSVCKDLISRFEEEHDG